MIRNPCFLKEKSAQLKSFPIVLQFFFRYSTYGVVSYVLTKKSDKVAELVFELILIFWVYGRRMTGKYGVSLLRNGCNY